MMRIEKRLITFLVLVIGIAALSYGQAGPPLTGPGPGGCFPPPCIPIDGGLSLLIAAGVGFAGKKAYDHHMKGGQ